MKTPITVPIEKLSEEPYASVVCYPRANPNEIATRIEELKQHGVKAVEFSGKASAFNMPVLGKGYVGLVAVAHVKGERVALKMRRVDADRQSLEHEAELLAKANSVDVGPKLLGVSKNFLLMHLVDGDLLEDWLETHKDTEAVRGVLVEILEQCWRLDEAGLDHGELSKAPKHLLVDRANKPFIVDFETSSSARRVANVTAVCQFLFAGNSTTAQKIATTLGEISREELIGALRNYKKERNRQNFESLLRLTLS